MRRIKVICTHNNPDWDSIGGVWLLQRFYNLEDEEVIFVNTGNPDVNLLLNAIAVVDTGKVYDVNSLRFDHHHLIGQAANDTCATKQVFEFLVSQNPTIEYLRPLIDLIFAGDTGRSEANFSRDLGIHALLSGYKAKFREAGEIASDKDVLYYGFSILDNLAIRLKNQTKAKAELVEKTVYKSEDGLVWAIMFGSAGSSFAAFDEGARIVIFEGEPITLAEGITYPIGIMRAGEWQEPHCGDLAMKVETLFPDEISKWFKHPAGFFAGRGTAKAPDYEPVKVDLYKLAQSIDEVWVR